MGIASADRAVIVCHDPSGSQWQLGLPSQHGAFALVGWTFDDTEGAVPPTPVARTIARGLINHRRVTFPCSRLPVNKTGRWYEWQGDFASTVKPARRAGRLLDWVTKRQLVLRSTTREEGVRCLFDDPFYQWWNQTQFALLSRRSEPPPEVLDEPALGDLLTLRWSAVIENVTRHGVDAILRPGVDGDVVGIVCSSSQVRAEIEQSLALAARDFELTCRSVSAEEFASLLLTVVDSPLDR